MNLVRRWEGTPASVRDALALARQRGQLVTYETLPARPGVAAVRVVLRVQTLPAAPARRRVPYRWLAAGVGLVGAAVNAAWLIWWLATSAWAWLTGHAAHVVGGLVVVLGGWWLLGQVGACPGVHCPGCRHH